LRYGRFADRLRVDGFVAAIADPKLIVHSAGRNVNAPARSERLRGIPGGSPGSGPRSPMLPLAARMGTS